MHVFRLADILQNTLTHSPTLTHSLTHSLRHNVYNTKGDIVWPIFPASTFSVLSTLCQHKDLLLDKKHWLPKHQRIISVISLVSWGKVPGYQFLCCVLSILKSEASFHTTISDFLCWVLSNSLRLSVVFSPTVGGFLLCSPLQSEAFSGWFPRYIQRLLSPVFSILERYTFSCGFSSSSGRLRGTRGSMTMRSLSLSSSSHCLIGLDSQMLNVSGI